MLGLLEQLNVDPDAAMRPFVPALDAFHARTRPADWLEGLVKAYVGDSISADFYRMIADLLDPRTQTLVNDVLADTGHADFVIVRVREAITANPSVACGWPCGPGAWSARRSARPSGSPRSASRSRLLAGGDPAQRGKIGRMFARLTDANSRRMAALGLTSHGTRVPPGNRSWPGSQVAGRRAGGWLAAG